MCLIAAYDTRSIPFHNIGQANIGGSSYERGDRVESDPAVINESGIATSLEQNNVAASIVVESIPSPAEENGNSLRTDSEIQKPQIDILPVQVEREENAVQSLSLIHI